MTSEEADFWTEVQLEVAFAISDENTAPDSVETVSPEDLPAPSTEMS